MALFKSKIEASRLQVPELHRFQVVALPPHLHSLRRLAPEVRRVAGVRSTETDSLSHETAGVATQVADVALKTAPIHSRAEGVPTVLFPAAAGLGALTGRLSTRLPGYVVGKLAPEVEVMCFQDKLGFHQPLGPFNEALIFGTVGDWAYDAAFYCAVTGRGVETLVPAMHAALRGELVKMFGQTVDVRHLQGQAV